MKRLIKLLFLVASIAFLIPVINSGDPVLIAGAVLFAAGVVVNLVTPYIPNGILGTSNMDARMVYENSKDALIKAFGTPAILDVCKLTQGFLRFEQAQVANRNIYDFPVLDNAGTPFNTEVRLKLQDSFVVSSILVASAAPSSATDNTFLIDTYANTQKYAATAALQTLWNAGNLQISVNRDVITPNWDIYRHYNASQTQQTDVLGAGSPMDQARGSFDGFYPCEPNIVLIGQKNTEIKVLLQGAGISAITASSRIVIMLRGVLAQNSTIVS